MKRIAFIFGILFFSAKVQACIDCTGTGTNVTFTGIVSASTVTAGWLIVGGSSYTTSSGGGSSNNSAASTGCITVGMSGEIYFASQTIFPIRNMSFPVRRATFTVISIDASLEYGSTRTVGWMAFRLGIATDTLQATTVNSPPNWFTGDIQISSTNIFAVHVPTTIPVNQDTSWYIGISSIQSSGNQPQGLKCTVCGWFNWNSWP